MLDGEEWGGGSGLGTRKSLLSGFRCRGAGWDLVEDHETRY